MDRKLLSTPFTFIDLFAGIGGFRRALNSLGGDCLFSSDYDKFSQITYEANFSEKPHGDITKIEAIEIPSHEVLCAGFPCQPFSIAGVSKKNSLGKKHGFEDEKQGNLFFHLLRIIQFHNPKILFLENVKNLKNHDNGNTWRVIEQSLYEAGYTLFTKIVDGVDYVPQHRERIFIIGFRRDIFPFIHFDFPQKPKTRKSLLDILEPKPDAKYTLTDHLWNYLKERKIKNKAAGKGFGYGLVDLEKDTHTRTLSARYHKDGSEILIKQNNSNPRRLTPRECARLQGFPDDMIIPVSDTQAYRQFGNSVVVPAIEATFKQILETVIQYENGQAKKLGDLFEVIYEAA